MTAMTDTTESAKAGTSAPAAKGAAKARPAQLPHPVSKTYLAAWLGIGMISAAYLSAVAIDPDILAELTRPATGVVTETAAGTGIMRQTVANVQLLQKAVTTLAGDVAQLKTSSQTQAARQSEVGDRVAQIENRLSGISAAAPVMPSLPRVTHGTPVASVEGPQVAASTPSSAMKLADQMAEPGASDSVAKAAEGKTQGRLGAPLASPVVNGVTVRPVAPGETRASRQVLQDQQTVGLLPSSIETGSTSRLGGPQNQQVAVVTPPVASAPVVTQAAKSAAAAPAPVKARPSTPAAVQIAAGPSIDALRLSWMLLSDKHSNILKPLEPRFVTDSTGVFRLVAGPFPSGVEAQRACADLKARGATCQTSDFGGDAL
jgi:hypothetical protein